MSEGEISAKVKSFIQQTISSVEQLEILLFLMSNSEREWTALDIAERIRISKETATQRMQELADAHLFIVSSDDPPRFRYSPQSAALEVEVARSLETAYRERRDSIMQLVYSRPIDHIRIFADAFRIKEDD